VKTSQVVLGFQNPVDVKMLVKILQEVFGEGTTTVGQGQAVNGIPNGWIVVHNERQR
jgi:hypothetical protein